ncbi:MAG: glucose 1-dehydrogenase [Gammaproteobacteria bacterium]|nr:glucose 1-dehydrogenase [Gammaproteobacteria bacterium]
MGRVTGKVAIVTGGASNPGLGRTTALTLGREGASVVVTDVNLEGAEKTAAEIRAAGGNAIAMAQDVTNESRWQEIIATTVSTYGKLDILVNNAGIAVLKTIADLTLADFQRQIDVNLTSVFLGCKYGMVQMKKNGGGTIVNLSSVAGLVGMATCGAYSASKGGVRLMTKVIAVEGGADNIRCNSVHPGVIWTNMQAAAVAGQGRQQPETGQMRIPLGRVGQPEDIANCILYLSSDESNYVTGAEFTVDAGMTAI